MREAWDRAVDTGYSRFRGANRIDDFLPNAMKTEQERQQDYATNRMDLDAVTSLHQPSIASEFDMNMNGENYNCQINEIIVPDIIDLTVYSINHDSFPNSSPSFAHVMYNDRVLMTKHRGSQILFAHYRPLTCATKSLIMFLSPSR